MDPEKSESSQHEIAVVGNSKMELDPTVGASPPSGKESPLQLDKSGLPLVPQPTAHKDDPLVGIPSSEYHLHEGILSSANSEARTGLLSSSFLSRCRSVG